MTKARAIISRIELLFVYIVVAATIREYAPQDWHFSLGTACGACGMLALYFINHASERRIQTE